jgi:hypothetical protein
LGGNNKNIYYSLFCQSQDYLDKQDDFFVASLNFSGQVFKEGRGRNFDPLAETLSLGRNFEPLLQTLSLGGIP